MTKADVLRAIDDEFDQPPAKASFIAKLLFKVAPLLAPDFSGDGAVLRAVAADRARGPARPPRKIANRIEFRDEVIVGRRQFRATRQGGRSSALRIFYIHGGAYIFDFQKQQWNLVWGLISRTGAEVVAPIYPLAPEQKWESVLAEVRQSYLSLVAECGEKNVIVVGDSAGGGLALALAHKLRDEGDPAPAGVVLFSPWLDAGVVGADQPELELRDPALTIEFLREAGLMWAGGTSLDDPRVSPLFGDQSGLPPTIIFTGTSDILDSDVKRLVARGSSALIREYPEMVHVWPIAPIPEAARALDEATHFIALVT